MSSPAQPSDHFSRTPAGQEEIQTRRLGLPRALRNLLLIIQPDRPGLAWLAQVQGAQPSDLARLLAEGLIAPVTPATHAPSPSLAPDARSPEALLRQRIDAATYSVLSTAITAQARSRLGLIKAYRLVLSVERAADVHALRALAHRLVDEWRQSHGEAALRELADALADATGASQPPP